MAPKAKKKKTTKGNKSDVSLLDKTKDMLNADYGAAIFESLANVKKLPESGISTGSIGLDYVICPRVGGMKRGHVLEIYGPESSGKTTLALGICANATANKEHVIYIEMGEL